LKLGGILGQQAETTLANGDFDTTFLILVCDIFDLLSQES
jgi:hypothetical protein